MFKMKFFSFTILALALLQIAKSVPCIGNRCGRLSQPYSVFDVEDGVFYIEEGSYNSASYVNDDKYEQPEKEDIYQLKEPQRSNLQRLRKNYEQSVGPNTSGQESYQSNQQLYNPSTPFNDNQETQYGFNNQGNYKSKNQSGGGKDFYQNNGGYYGHYPDRDSSCPNCYATDFGNGDYNNNIINIEK